MDDVNILPNQLGVSLNRHWNRWYDQLTCIIRIWFPSDCDLYFLFPGLGFRPRPPESKIESTLIWFSSGVNGNYQPYVDNLESFLKGASSFDTIDLLHVQLALGLVTNWWILIDRIHSGFWTVRKGRRGCHCWWLSSRKAACVWKVLSLQLQGSRTWKGCLQC